jgi:hypothetical protein
LSATADEIGQVWDFWLALDAETGTELIAEGDAVFGCGAHQAEEGVAAVVSIEIAGATTDFALGDMTADVTLGTIGMQRYLRAVERHQQLGLVGVQSLKQTIEGDEAGMAVEDAGEADA